MIYFGGLNLFSRERMVGIGRPSWRGVLSAGFVLVGLLFGWGLAVQIAGFEGIGMLACL
tara:strand:- start:204 stop:380 length:177 start_codon:yes stop_codon:yes gene_type:complete